MHCHSYWVQGDITMAFRDTPHPFINNLLCLCSVGVCTKYPLKVNTSTLVDISQAYFFPNFIAQCSNS